LPRFRFVPVLSEAVAGDGWTGRTGLVHQAVMEDLPDLSGHQVYACGAPVMVEAARRDFVKSCGLQPDAFHADAFTSVADRIGAEACNRPSMLCRAARSLSVRVPPGGLGPTGPVVVSSRPSAARCVLCPCRTRGCP